MPLTGLLFQVVETSGATMTRPSPISASQADMGTVERWCEGRPLLLLLRHGG